MDAATANLVLVVAGSLAPAAVWLLVPLHDWVCKRCSDCAEAIVWTVTFHLVPADDYRGADAD